MRQLFFLFLTGCSVCLFAQKGTLIPDVKPKAAAISPELETKSIAEYTIKEWVVTDKPVRCADSVSNCLVVYEKDVRKLIPQKDVFDLDYQEGYTYTIRVKQIPKAASGNNSENNYYYLLEKLIARKASPVNPAPPVPAKNTAGEPADELQALKKEVEELKKQIRTIQLQMEMQLQLMQKEK